MEGIFRQHSAKADGILGMSPSDVTRAVQAVSLGSSCGTKLTLRRLGLGEATMPFDWMRTSARGLIHWVRHGFGSFFHIHERYDITYQARALTVYRTPTHAFWHDDLDDEGSREKLWRRVLRFQDLATDDSGRALLFVRAVAGTAELQETEALFEALQACFQAAGRRVYLLVVIEDQGMVGPILHSAHEGLLFWVQPAFAGTLSLDPDVPAPYEDAVAFAVRRIMGDPRGHFPNGHQNSGYTWPDVPDAAAILEPHGHIPKGNLKHSEIGLWVGNVLIRGAEQEIFMGAFTGSDLPRGGFRTCSAPTQTLAASASNL